MNKVVIAALLASFTNIVAATSDMNAATKDVCKCLEAPYAKAKEALAMIQQAQATGDVSELMAAQGEMMSVINTSTRCFEHLSKKYQDIANDEKLKKEIMAKAEKQCPNPVSKFFGKK